MQSIAHLEKLRSLTLACVVGASTLGCETNPEKTTYRKIKQAQSGSFTERSENTVNPGRGFINMVHWDPSYQAGTQSTTVYRLGLADFCNTNDITAPLASFQVALNQFRAAGKKLILRMMYSTLLGEPNGCGTGHAFEPANYNVLKAHLDQLAPLLANNRDALAYVQAGVLGPWGEWHGFGIQNGPNGYETIEDRGEMLQDQQVAWGNVPASSRDNRLTVVRLLLDALPAALPLQLRRPTFLYETMQRFDGNGRNFANQYTGQTDSFTDSEIERFGLFNDCFVASFNDYGTYSPDYGAIYFPEIDTVAESMAWAESQSAARMLGGETCPAITWERMDCVSVVPEMERLHWTYLNRNWWGPAMTHWQTQGCYDEIERRMGYRLLFESAAASPQVDPGQGETVLATATVQNVGFAAPHIPGTARFTLTRGASRYRVGEELTLVPNAESGTDPSSWEAGQTTLVSQEFQPPATPGVYHLALEILDEHGTAPNYSVRISSNVNGNDVWDPTHGENETGLVVTVLGTCQPLACSEVGGCGIVEDGCGSTQDCGSCESQALMGGEEPLVGATMASQPITAVQKAPSTAPTSGSLRVVESLSVSDRVKYEEAVKLALDQAKTSGKPSTETEEPQSKGKRKRNRKK